MASSWLTSTPPCRLVSLATVDRGWAGAAPARTGVSSPTTPQHSPAPTVKRSFSLSVTLQPLS